MTAKWIRALSFKKKLVLSFSLMISLTFILGAALLHSLHQLSRQVEDYERMKSSFEIVNDSIRNFIQMRRAMDGYLIGINSDRERYAGLAHEMEENLERLRAVSKAPTEKENRRNLEIAFKTFSAQVDPVFSLAAQGRRSDAMARMDDSAFSILDGIAKKLENLSFSIRREADRAWEDSKRLARQALLSSLTLFLSILLAGAGLSIGLYRSISHPLSKLREGAKSIGEGRWDIKMDVSDPPELKDLAKSFEEMAESLTGLQVHVMQLDRMSAVGTLAGGVAHEINNPLTGVLGQAQLLLEKLPPADPLRLNVEKIERAAQKCRKIVRGLLDFSRPSDYIFQAVDVNPIIPQAMDLCGSEMALRNIQIRWEPNPALPKIWASENHLEQIFVNLLTNALHAMPGGGLLSIQTVLVRPKAFLSGQPWKEGIAHDRDHVAISFTDTGVGIPPENLPHLFDPFFTTKEPGKGTGLGLSISYNIAKMHQGELTAESGGLGKGACLTVRVPIHQEPEPVSLTGTPFEVLDKKMRDFESRFE